MTSPQFNHPDTFMADLLSQPDWFSLATAKKLDKQDPLAFTSTLFQIGDLLPFAGHSLGPVFKPVLQKIQETSALQIKFQEGHYPHSHPEGKDSGHWFDCDRHRPSIRAARNMLGFADDSEFIFTASGLSQNLGLLMETFFRPTQKDWKNGKTKMIMLETEFFSDQAIAVSVAKRALQIADAFGCFDQQDKPSAESLILKIKPEAKGLYSTEQIIHFIRTHAAETQLICLSDVVFNTGQRLELQKIFSALQTVLDENHIIVGLDLAHTVGNRLIDLKTLPVTFAVGCAYKHLSGFAGSGFGMYVNQKADLNKYPPIQGWKAADASRVFQTINHYDASIMEKQGALAFRASNPAPIALLPVQTFLTYFDGLGFENCVNKSECLTRYLWALLKHHLGEQLEFITPEDPAQRGAMLVFSVKGLSDAHTLKEFLKSGQAELGCFDVDVRPPNNIRLTAHYAYTQFVHIQRLVEKLSLAIKRKN